VACPARQAVDTVELAAATAVVESDVVKAAAAVEFGIVAAISVGDLSSLPRTSGRGQRMRHS